MDECEHRADLRRVVNDVRLHALAIGAGLHEREDHVQPLRDASEVKLVRDRNEAG
jgi:hypothetical protein